MENVEKFNVLVGLIFARLYSQHPLPVRLNGSRFLSEVVNEDEHDESFDFNDYFNSTVKWLEKAGYIWIETDFSSMGGNWEYELMLSERGFEALRKTPESLDGSESLGQKFVRFSKDKSSEVISILIEHTVNSAISG